MPLSFCSHGKVERMCICNRRCVVFILTDLDVSWHFVNCHLFSRWPRLSKGEDSGMFSLHLYLIFIFVFFAFPFLWSILRFVSFFNALLLPPFMIVQFRLSFYYWASSILALLKPPFRRRLTRSLVVRVTWLIIIMPDWPKFGWTNGRSFTIKSIQVNASSRNFPMHFNQTKSTYILPPPLLRQIKKSVFFTLTPVQKHHSHPAFF